MNPYLLIAVAAAAYYAYTKVAEPQRALPPAPPEVPETPEEDERLTAWDTLYFDVDVFPAGKSRTKVLPPANPDVVAVTPGCIAIAVGHGFWERLDLLSDPLFAEGMTVEQVWHQLLEDEVLFPGALVGVKGGAHRHSFYTCREQGKRAAKLFEDEIVNRLRYKSGPWLGVQ